MNPAPPLPAELDAVGGRGLSPVPEGAGVEPADVVRMLLSAGGAMLSQAVLHAQLARVEWAVEKNRLLKMLWITLLGFAGLLCALLFAGGLLLSAVWETAYRIPVAAGLVWLYGFAAAIAWRHFQAQSALGEQSFAALRQELAADMALLRNRP